LVVANRSSLLISERISGLVTPDAPWFESGSAEAWVLPIARTVVAREDGQNE
jgi:hypothetical protein